MSFDPEMFLNTQTEDANETQFQPIPENEYTAVIDDLKPRVVNDKPVLDVVWAIDDEGVKAETGLDKPTVRQTIWLDVDSSGNLEAGKNKNISLGRLRDALKQNEPGKPWSPQMLLGNVARINVTHTMKDDKLFVNVNKVAAL